MGEITYILTKAGVEISASRCDQPRVIGKGVKPHDLRQTSTNLVQPVGGDEIRVQEMNRGRR